MPVMLKSGMTLDGGAWNERYANVGAFHDDVSVPPVAAGELGRRYLERIRYMLARLHSTELPKLEKIAETIAAELRAGKKTVVAAMGHMGMNFIGRFDDGRWAANHEVSDGLESQMTSYEKTPDGALVLRLGYVGLHRDLDALFRRKGQRVMLIAAENPRPEFAVPESYEPHVDYGFAFGDACVALEGYPISILPPSGVMQVAAYEAINVAVQQRHAP